MANTIKLRDSCTRLTSCHDNASRVNFNLTGNYLFVSTLQLNPCYVHCAWTNTSGISLLKLIIIYFNFRWLFWKCDLKKSTIISPPVWPTFRCIKQPKQYFVIFIDWTLPSSPLPGRCWWIANDNDMILKTPLIHFDVPVTPKPLYLS